MITFIEKADAYPKWCNRWCHCLCLRNLLCASQAWPPRYNVNLNKCQYSKENYILIKHLTFKNYSYCSLFIQHIQPSNVSCFFTTLDGIFLKWSTTHRPDFLSTNPTPQKGLFQVSILIAHTASFSFSTSLASHSSILTKRCKVFILEKYALAVREEVVYYSASITSKQKS